MGDEVKVVFEEDGETRALRGVITGDDGTFITLERRDGIVKIARRVIIKIEAFNTP